MLVYCETLASTLAGHTLKHIRVLSPFVLRSIEPPLDVLDGQALRTVSRVGKRLVFAFDDGLRLVVHLMIAGRQRIVYVENECNYCAICQTEGRLLADRALSRLLRDDWPRRLEEW